MTAVSIAALVLTASCAADEVRGAANQQREQRRAQFLDEMRTLAVATKVRHQEDERPLKLVDSPVFRYDDQPRRFLDATIWVWTDRGRPVAFQKIEAMPHAWQFCFTSLADDLLEIEWSGNQRYRSTEPGVAFRPLTDAPAVAAGSAQRKRQARDLARGFSARIVIDPANNHTEAMRFLPTPIFEYSEPTTKMFQGAVYGLTTNGTNPDLLLLLEARGENDALRWNYAVARMTTGGLNVRYREIPVWEAEFVAPRPTSFPTWTFFSTPRLPADDQTADRSAN